MNYSNQKFPLPSITISKASTPLEDSLYGKSPTYEPEMEDLHDESLLRNLAEELGLQESLGSDPNPLVHKPEAGDSCLHCTLFKKVSSLQSDIMRMSREIASTGEVLSLKKEQNTELKGMIDRLKGTCEVDEVDNVVEEKAVNCTCIRKCVVY